MAAKKRISAEHFAQKNLQQQAFFKTLDEKQEARKNFIALVKNRAQPSWKLADSVAYSGQRTRRHPFRIQAKDQHSA